MRCLYDNDTDEQLLKTALRYNRRPEEEVKDLLCRNLWPRKGYCFGLDSDSHAANVGFCTQRGIRYRYMIWDQSPTIPLSGLLTEEVEPYASIRLKRTLIQPTDFLGMYYSPPSETSAIGQGKEDEGNVRTQLMLDATYLFTEWRLSPEQELTRVAPPVFTG